MSFENITDKMIGNAVPCNLAYCLAKTIKEQLYKARNNSFQSTANALAE
jgi:hypothetical protein